MYVTIPLLYIRQSVCPGFPRGKHGGFPRLHASTSLDIGNLGIEYAGAHTNVTQGVEELWNARERILASFLSDIGVKTGIDKRSNSVSDEINADTPSLLVNLDDMLNSRKEGFDRVNRHYGTNWTVELNENIDYVNMFTDPTTPEKEKEDVKSN